MTESTHAFVLELITTVPNLRSVFDEHIQDYDELLPHVLFGGLTRYVVSLYASVKDSPSTQPGWKELDKILAFLENGLSGKEPEIQELIAVSFLENLDPTDRDLGGLEQRFGPNLRIALKSVRGFS